MVKKETGYTFHVIVNATRLEVENMIIENLYPVEPMEREFARSPHSTRYVIRNSFIPDTSGRKVALLDMI